MEYPQIGGGGVPSHDRQTSLGASNYAVLCVPFGIQSENLRCVDGVDTLETVYDWETALGEWQTPGEWDWQYTMTITTTRLLASERLEGLPRTRLHNPFRSEAEKLNPWASRLSKQDIRLFAMELDDKHEITGTLLDFERSECPRYSALSYVCGQGSCDQEIYVNGGSLCVKPNLLAALKQLKSYLIRRTRGNEDLSVPLRHKFCWVWVDAMCINQEDATEKAGQVGEMHHVYREAKRVAVCLGPFDPEFGCVTRILQWVEGVRYPAGSGHRRWTQLELVEQLRGFDVSPSNLLAIFDTLKIDLDRHLGTHPHECLIDRISKDEVLGFEESSVVASPMPNDHPFVGEMLGILEHEWFSRLWTYQEYFLALRSENRLSFEFVLEDHAIHWNTFIECSFVAMYSTDCQNVSLLERGSKNIRRLCIETPLYQRSDSGAIIWTLLETSCQRRASVAGDRVFAVVGLMEPEMRSHIIIDLHKCFRTRGQSRRWWFKAAPLLGKSRSHSANRP
jgi:hypothetical protein